MASPAPPRHSGDNGTPAEFADADAVQMAAWNSTERAYPRDRTVQQLVEARVAAAPGAPALVQGRHVVTYGELDRLANQLARHLRGLGVDRGVPVGVCLERSPHMVVGALAILKAGGAYVPLDPDSPSARNRAMLLDARAPVVITRRSLFEGHPQGGWRIVDLDADSQSLARHPDTPPDLATSVSDLAYVIYTSGSTGEPKGVLVGQDGLLNLIHWHVRAFAVTPADRATQLASPGFDAAVWEVWPYLVAGASVHFPDDETRRSPEPLVDWLVAHEITICFLPTPLAEAVLTLPWPAGTRLRTLLTGADTLRRYPPSTVPFTLVNNYGPTECTVVATSGVVPAAGPSHALPSIGLPIDNTQIFILDESLRRVPIGVAGDLYVAGPGVARGYLNRPELTAQRFLQNPLADRPDAIMYRTGDRARFLPDGQIAFLGRADDQIKIRGFRIEPNEISTILNRHPSVNASVVSAHEVPGGDRRLVAYVVPAPDAVPSVRELSEFLRGQVPDYMVPVTWVCLQALPLTSRGKVDRAALPVPGVDNALHDEVASRPLTAVEGRLTGMLGTLLGLDSVGVDENFFLLGGHSLLGTQLIARVRDVFHVELTLRSLFDAPTVASLAAEVERLLVAKLEAMSEDEVQRLLDGASPDPGVM